MKTFTCIACEQDMLTAFGCESHPTALTRRQEVEYLRECGWHDDDLPEVTERCRDCGATPDGYHHLMCCVAMCAQHGQRMLCDCDTT